MYTDNRKLYVIEAILGSEDEILLSESEGVIAHYRKPDRKVSAYDFVGVISEEDGELIEKAIEEDCEQIHPDDWK